MSIRMGRLACFKATLVGTFAWLILNSVAVVLAGDYQDGMDAYRRQDYAMAFTKLTKAAEPPVVKPSREEFIKITRQNHPEMSDAAIVEAWDHLFGHQAELTRALAAVMVAQMYDVGQGIPQNQAQAAQWYMKAAVADIPIAQYNLGLLYFTGNGVQKDFVLAYMWLNLAARGEPEAVKWRDKIGGFMTPAQLAEANTLAREWKPSR